MLTRPSSVVHFHPPYAPCILTVDPHPLNNPTAVETCGKLRPLCDHCHCYRSNDGCVELWPFFPDRDGPLLTPNVLEGIRRDREEQVILWCNFRSDCGAARFGDLFSAVDGTGLSEFLNRLFLPMFSHRSSVQPPPGMNLDVHNACIPWDRRPAVFAFSSVSVALTTRLPALIYLGSPDVLRVSRPSVLCDIADLFTFLIIFVAARVPRTSRFPSIPTILDAILRDATVYFLVMAAAQLSLKLFSTLFSPVGGPYHIKGLLVLLHSPVVHTQRQIRFLPEL